MTDIPLFPHKIPLDLSHHKMLEATFSVLRDGIAEFVFSNLYLFRGSYNYQLSRLSNGHLIIWGTEMAGPFCMLPQGLPKDSELKSIMQQVSSIKCVSETIARQEEERCRWLALRITEDRDNFDYLYLREELATLRGRKFHKKRNFVNYFEHNFNYAHIPLTPRHVPAALEVLNQWKREHSGKNDYDAAVEALHRMDTLELRGYLTLVDDIPCGYSLGQQLTQGTMFVVHFEKATTQYRGIFQFINKAMAAELPASITYINREQDLGDPGLRQAKMTYRPVKLVPKYRIVS